MRGGRRITRVRARVVAGVRAVVGLVTGHPCPTPRRQHLHAHNRSNSTRIATNRCQMATLYKLRHFSPVYIVLSLILWNSISATLISYIYNPTNFFLSVTQAHLSEPCHVIDHRNTPYTRAATGQRRTRRRLSARDNVHPRSTARPQ